MKNNCLYFLFLFVLTSCSSGEGCLVGEDKKDNCEALNTFQLADSSQSLDFNHYCSEEKLSLSAYKQSYALFEDQSGNDKTAGAVGAVKAGFIRGAQKATGIGLRLEKLKIQSLSSWANQNLALAIQLINTKNQKKFTGEFVTSYIEGKSGKTEVKNYQISPQGSLVWERFREPETPAVKKQKVSKIPEKHPSILSQDIDSLEASYRIHLLLKNQTTGEMLTLIGPVIENLKILLQIKAPEFQALGFLDTINPFQKGGLWHWLGSGFYYKDCIYLRKQSKYELDKRFQ